jgi:hypothetical protein
MMMLELPGMTSMRTGPGWGLNATAARRLSVPAARIKNVVRITARYLIFASSDSPKKSALYASFKQAPASYLLLCKVQVSASAYCLLPVKCLKLGHGGQRGNAIANMFGKCLDNGLSH